MRRDPGSRLFAQLAEEERKSGDLEEAIRVARAGLAVHPTYPAAWLTLGRGLLDSGDAEGARMALQEAVKQAPENILARRFLGLALEAVGNLEGAVGAYRATLAMAQGDAPLEAQVRALEAKLARRAAGEERAAPTRSEKGAEAARAEMEAEGGVALGGEAPPFSSSTLAELYLRQGFAEQAIEVYRQVVAEHPEADRARARLAELVSVRAGGKVDGGREDCDEQECRRRALRRTIAGLELLLGMARRR